MSRLFSKEVLRDLTKYFTNHLKNFSEKNSKQITNFMDPSLSKYQCGFRRGFSEQNCLLAVLEKWKSLVNKGKAFAGLSKVFDY